MRLLLRHCVAAAATVGVVALWTLILPSVAQFAAETLQEAARERSSAVFGPEPYLTVNVEADPLNVGPWFLGIAAVCILGRAGRRRWPFLSWALPFVVALLAGMVTGISAYDVLFGRPVAVLLGLAAALMAFTLVGAYWWTLLFISRRKAAGQR
jgi:hypothetical protein